MVKTGDIPKEFRSRWMRGDRTAQLAADLQVSEGTVRYWVWKLSLPTRPMGRHTREFKVAYMEKKLEAQRK